MELLRQLLYALCCKQEGGEGGAGVGAETQVQHLASPSPPYTDTSKQFFNQSNVKIVNQKSI